MYIIVIAYKSIAPSVYDFSDADSANKFWAKWTAQEMEEPRNERKHMALYMRNEYGSHQLIYNTDKLYED